MTDPAPPPPDRGHARTASILLALAEIPWIVVAVQQIGGGHPPLGVWNLFVAGVALAVAAAVFFAHALAWTPALVAAYYTIGFSTLWAAREGEKLLWASAVAAAGAVAFINAARPRPAAPPPAPARAPAGDGRPDTVVVWIKENLEAIVVAFIMALVIRCFCIEVFKIPSSSMEPTLLGDARLGRRTDGPVAEHNGSRCTFEDEHVAESGDRIMVTKYYYAFADLERFDVVVFKFPLNQARNFIKRVVGLPGETIRVHDGNIYVRDGDGRFRIARRPPRTQRSVWIPIENGLGAGEKFFETWMVETGTENSVGVDDGRIAVVHPAVLRYKEAIGDMRSGGSRVDDLRLAFDLEITQPKGELFAEIANDYGRFELRLATDGESRLLWFNTFGRTAQPKLTMPLKTRLEMDRRLRVDLWVHDGLAQAWIDGRPDAHIEYIKDREDAEAVEDARQTVRFGSRDLTFRVENLRVGRDIHYIGKDNLPEDEPVEIKPGHFVVMGDNVNHSHDSRSWQARAFRLKDGRIVRAENQAINGVELTASQLQDRWGLPALPNYAIAGDEQGRTWALYHEDSGPVPPEPFVGVIDKELKDEALTGPMWQIDTKFLVGKALWVWWPQGRWFRLIR